MDARRINQIWLAGGIAAIIILVAGAWLLLISPKYAAADQVQADADDTSIQLTRLNKEVAALRAAEEKKDTYQAAVDELALNLPENYGIPEFLRALQTSDSAVGVEVADVNVGEAVTSGSVPTAVEVPISLSVTGSVADVSRWLVRLQNVQHRAVLVDAVSLPDLKAKQIKATVSLNAYCTTAEIDDSDNKPKTTGSDVCKAA